MEPRRRATAGRETRFRLSAQANLQPETTHEGGPR